MLKTERQLIACVTGASGLVGKKIVEKLLQYGYKVRVLTRRSCCDSRVDVFNSSITDKNKVREFLYKADILIHCAAELKNEAEMYKTNVNGTKIIVELLQEINNIKYFCYLSSVGVVGKTKVKEIDENTICYPKNKYEKTKFEAEKIITETTLHCKKIILRPTNIVGINILGGYKYLQEQSIINWLKIFIIGSEYPHMVHYEDVANAAIYFINNNTNTNTNNNNIYNVSIDDEASENLVNLWSLYRKEKGLSKISIPYLPLRITNIVRMIIGKQNNKGIYKYTSKKLIKEGFEYKYSSKDIIKEIF